MHTLGAASRAAVPGGRGRLSAENEQRRRRRGSWPALKARGTNGGGDAQVLDAAGGALEGFPGHASREERGGVARGWFFGGAASGPVVSPLL